MALDGTAPMTWSLPSLLDVIKRRWLLISILISACVIAATVALLLAVPVYTAEARVKIDPRQQTPISTKDALVGGAPDTAMVDTEVSTMRSPEVARLVVQQLNLTRDTEFARASGERAIDSSAQALMSQLEIGRAGTTYSVTIRAKSKSPKKAALIANAVASAYLQVSRDQRAALAADQARSLETELGALGANVTAADARVAGLRGQAGIVGSSAAGGNVTDQQITTIAIQLASADSDAAASSAVANAARSQVSNEGAEAVSQVLNSAALRELREQRAQILREQADVASKLGPRHPTYLKVNEQLRTVDRQISEEALRIISGLESDARAAGARASALRAQLATLQAEQSGNARAAVTVDSLQRNADAMRTTYNDMNRSALQQTQEARIGYVRSSIATFATPPLYPSSPNQQLYLAVGLLLGIASATGTVIILEALSLGFRTAESIEGTLDIEVLGVVPELERKQVRELRASKNVSDYVVTRPTSAFAESLRSVRGALMLSRSGDIPKVITVTSTLPNEGKTTSAISLARVMALAGDRVLLIDCDLRRNGLAPLTPEPPEVGLLELLEGSTTFENAVVLDRETSVAILPLRGSVFTAKDVFSGSTMRDMLSSIESRYDFVILDAPPALALADARTLSAMSDATIMIIRCVKTPARAVEAAVTRLREDGAYIVGAVLTRVSKAHGLSLTDPSYYEKAYRNYYRG